MHVLEKHGINPSTLGLLIFIKNGCIDSYSENILQSYLYEFRLDDGRTPIQLLEEAELVHYIKSGKKSDPPYKRLRLSEKGTDVVNRMFDKPLHHLTEFTLNYIKDSYLKIGADKSYIKGGNKILNYISEFLHSRPSEYSEKMIVAVIDAYISQFESDKKYLNKMDTLFFKPPNAFSTRWSAENCPLCNFIDNNIDLIKVYYGKKT